MNFKWYIYLLSSCLYYTWLFTLSSILLYVGLRLLSSPFLMRVYILFYLIELLSFACFFPIMTIFVF